MGVLDGGGEAAISSAGSPQHGSRGPRCSPWFTWQLFCIALASDLVRVCLGRFLWGWEQQLSSGRLFPPPLLFPPCLEGFACCENRAPAPQFPLEAAQPVRLLRIKAPTMAERKKKIKIAAWLRLSEANTCRNMQMSPTGCDSRPWLFARRQSRAASRRLASFPFPPSHTLDVPRSLISQKGQGMRRRFQSAAGVGEFPQGISFLPVHLGGKFGTAERRWGNSARQTPGRGFRLRCLTFRCLIPSQLL